MKPFKNNSFDKVVSILAQAQKQATGLDLATRSIARRTTPVAGLRGIQSTARLGADALAAKPT